MLADTRYNCVLCVLPDTRCNCVLCVLPSMDKTPVWILLLMNRCSSIAGHESEREREREREREI